MRTDILLIVCGLLWLTLPALAHEDDEKEDDLFMDPRLMSSCDRAPYAQVEDCPSVVGTSYDCEGRGHLPEGDKIPWKSNPPHSGAHYPRWERQAGEHQRVIPRGRWVHNLEHGHILLLYNCPDGCTSELGVLREVLEERFELSLRPPPDPKLTGPRFAAVAWTWIYRTDQPDLSKLLCFIDQHINQG
ncbi:MAG: DUF3105 domain-containing protein, partial [Chromatiales bacterium]|nr:DUF3105 domain-containing protein [Chromatiales bacterium]